MWVPDASLAGPTEEAGEEFMWAALDCPSGFAGLIRGELPPMLLGRMSAMVLAPAPIGEPVVCTGWVEEHSGRKLVTGSALFDGDGTLLATARAIWIELQP